jgi:hypothetical protein
MKIRGLLVLLVEKEQSRLELYRNIQCFQCLPFLNLHRVTNRVTIIFWSNFTISYE